MFPSQSSSTTGSHQPKRTLNRIIDLERRRSIGKISSIEFKRRGILHQLNCMAYATNKTSNYPYFLDHLNFELFDQPPVQVTSMDLDKVQQRCLLAAFESNILVIYNVDTDNDIFKTVARMGVPRSDDYDITNAVHWLYDGTQFTTSSKRHVYFWDSKMCCLMENVQLNTQILNHVIAKNEYISNNYVAATGIKGHVFVIDMRHAVVVMTMPNVEKSPIRAIKWHPTNEFQYVIGNDLGNICVWDIRFRKNYIRKFKNNDPFVKATSHSHPVASLSFYNNDHRILSIDLNGTIKSWAFNEGRSYPNQYAPLEFNNTNIKYVRSYQFATTENLKQDIAFLPSKKGMRMFDIDTGEHLPNSNDEPLSLNCACYSSKRLSVYSASNNVIKAWTTDKIHN